MKQYLNSDPVYLKNPSSVFYLKTQLSLWEEAQNQTYEKISLLRIPLY